MGITFTQERLILLSNLLFGDRYPDQSFTYLSGIEIFMPYFLHQYHRISSLALVASIGLQFSVIHPSKAAINAQLSTSCQVNSQNQSLRPKTNFLAIGGGPEPEANEIAIEKNILYFQRTLTLMGYNPAEASTFFANGNDGQATVRYLDSQGQQQFKIPQIPHLIGASTMANLQRSIQELSSKSKSIFFYFTGHGIPNPENIDNNAFLLWNRDLLTVQQFSTMLDRLPADTSVVTMMSQCFSGSFANFIYSGGDPERPVALQTRCGFFATVKTRPSVGCSPAVNEADYRDYSSSFFAGLSGRSRTGQPVASADYNQDRKISYSEAHAFAKVDEYSSDWPISTSEAWLQNQTDRIAQQTILSLPMAEILQTARPEQRYVVNSIAQKFNFNLQKSFLANVNSLDASKVSSDEQKAYVIRLGMELTNIGTEKQIRSSGDKQAIATLDKLLKCESSSWK